MTNIPNDLASRLTDLQVDVFERLDDIRYRTGHDDKVIVNAVDVYFGGVLADAYEEWIAEGEE